MSNSQRRGDDRRRAQGGRPSGGSDRRDGGKGSGRSGGQRGDGRSAGGGTPKSGRSSDASRSDRSAGNRSGSGRSDSPRRGSGTAGQRSDRSGGRPPAGRSGSGSGGTRDPRRSITVVPGGDLPRWVREEITRSTPKDRREAALRELQLGLGSYSVGRHRVAAGALRKAKDLSPRSATVRELLGLSLYQLEDWEGALRELRTFRRLAGETTHLAVEMDCLRALGRPGDVEKAWAVFEEFGADRDAEDEIRVVFASHLLDQGRVSEAWKVIKPGRLLANAPEAALRRWAVAARVAHAAGDREAVKTLVDAIRKQDPDLDWLEDLQSALGI